MSVAVRVAGSTDAAALHEVAAVTFPLACPPGSEQHDIDAFIAENLSEAKFGEYLADSNSVVLVAENDGEAVGYTMLVFGDPVDSDVSAAVAARPTVELSKVYVMPGLHGAGVAATMVSATLDAARERGVASVWLGVNQQNLRANRFYEKSGFVKMGVKTFWLGGDLQEDFVRELVF